MRGSPAPAPFVSSEVETRLRGACPASLAFARDEREVVE